MPVVGAPYQGDTQNVAGEGIGTLLGLVLSGVSQKRKEGRDKAYRSAAATALGVPEEELGFFQRDELADLIKEKHKSALNPKEWKPRNKDEALEIASAKRISKEDNSVEKAQIKAESDMKNNYGKYVIAAEKIGNTPKSFEEFKKMFEPAPAVNPGDKQAGIDAAKAAADRVAKEGAAKKQQGTGMGNILQQIMGGVNTGNPLGGFLNMIRPQPGAVTTPVPTEVPKIIPQPGEIAPGPAIPEKNIAMYPNPELAQEAAQSPYPEYPDAVLENGVWKVVREGKKYRLEE